MKKLFFIMIMIVAVSISHGQTILINPAGDGGFETGADFATNGWIVDNGTQANQWAIGTVSASPNNNAAFISNDAGVSWAYTLTTSSVVHFYRDITFPAGETDIQLTFLLKGIGETSWDRLRVYLVPTTTTPVSGTALTAGQIGNANYNLQGAWVTVGLQVPASAAGTTQRLVFSWANDASLGTNPPVSIDNISLKSQIPYTMSGLYQIDNTMSTGGMTFKSFNDAILTLNSATITGPIAFQIPSGMTFWENLPVITATGTSANPISFFKFGVTANPIILSGGYSTTTDAIIAINGGDYFSFNGIDLALADPTLATVENGYYIFNNSSTNGAQYNTILNSKIKLNRSSTSSRGIYQNVATAPTNATGANSNNFYQNIIVENSYNGIVCTGNATYPDLATIISNCIVGADSPNDIGNGTSAISGIRLTSNSGVTVENNIVRNLTINGGSNVFALFLENVQGNSQVYGNKIYNLKSTSTSTSAYLQGIRVDVPATHQAAIYNNIVFGFTHAISTPSATMVSRGIAVNVTGTGSVGVTYNTVHLNLGAAATNTAMWIGTGTVTLANNIFANSSTAGATSKRYCIYRNGAAVLLSNYNDFYIAVNTNNFVGYYTTDMIDLLAWQGASLQDANSVNIDPLFTGADNLRPTNPALNNLGTPVPITTDIDGVIRDAAFPDMGAYEFTPPSCIMPLAIVVTNITANSADLGWTSSAPEFQIEWGEAPLVQGTGTFIITSSNPYPLIGLDQYTNYEFYVRAICNVGDTSLWSNKGSFTTSCGVNSLPFTESFDGTTFAPACWTNIKTAGAGTPGIWDRQTVGTNPTCAPHSGAGMARYNAYSLSAGTTGLIATPALDFPADNYVANFWMYRDNGYPTYTELVNVYFNTTPAVVGGTLLGTINRSSALAPVVAANGWYNYSFEVPAGTIGTGYIVFEAVSNFGNNIFIDDIAVRETVSATINPIVANYDITFPADVSTTVTWNDAASITSIVDDQAIPYNLVLNTDYTITGNTLTILDAYLSTVLLVATDDIVLNISSNLGNDMTFTITAIETVFVDAEVNPDAADYDLTYPADVVATVTWNDATVISSIVDDEAVPYNLILNTDYTLSGTTLTILDSYLAGVLLAATDEVVLTINFDLGVETLTITAIETTLVDAVVNPDSANYDLTFPADVVGTITWNDATVISSIVDDETVPYNLILNTDYTVSGTTLTILDSYLAGVLLAATDEVVLTINFDLGVETLTITAIESPSGPDVIAHWTFEDLLKQATITDSTTFMTTPYTADNGIAANVNIAPISIAGGSKFTAWVGGSGGTGTWAANADGWVLGTDTKYWFVTISTFGYENLKLSSKQRGSNTGPRDFKVQYSTDGLSWTDVPSSSITVAGNFTTGVLDGISLPAACNNQNVLMLRWIMTSEFSVTAGAISAAGTNRIDDILITGDLVSVDIQESISTAQVYPNPSNGQFTIYVDQDWVMNILDITGRMISSEMLHIGNNEINLLGQPAGIYILRLTRNDQTQTIRIVIE